MQLNDPKRLNEYVDMLIEIYSRVGMSIYKTTDKALCRERGASLYSGFLRQHHKLFPLCTRLHKC